MRRAKVALDREKGQALVEFALVSIILFTVLIGIVDLARLYFTYSSMSNAAREGCRYAVIDPYDTTGIEDHAKALLVIFGTDPEVQISFPDGARNVDLRVRVQVTCDFELLMLPVPPFQMSADSTMRIETVP